MKQSNLQKQNPKHFTVLKTFSLKKFCIIHIIHHLLLPFVAKCDGKIPKIGHCFNFESQITISTLRTHVSFILLKEEKFLNQSFKIFYIFMTDFLQRSIMGQIEYVKFVHIFSDLLT